VDSSRCVTPFIGLGEGEARGPGGWPSVVSGQHLNRLLGERKGETEGRLPFRKRRGGGGRLDGMGGRRMHASGRTEMVVAGSASEGGRRARRPGWTEFCQMLQVGQSALAGGKWMKRRRFNTHDFNRTTNPTAKTMRVMWRNHSTENLQYCRRKHLGGCRRKQSRRLPFCAVYFK
jgi:hypothetical protein